MRAYAISMHSLRQASRSCFSFLRLFFYLIYLAALCIPISAPHILADLRLPLFPSALYSFERIGRYSIPSNSTPLLTLEDLVPSGNISLTSSP